MNEEFNTATQSELTQIMEYLDESCDGLRPAFVAVTSWFTLHEMVHCGGENEVDLVKSQDLVKDYWCKDDCSKIVGFNDDVGGRKALDILGGWIGLDQVWKLNENGQYEETILAPSPYLIDLSNPDEVSSHIRDFMARHIG